MDDADLVEAAKRGDEGAFEALVDRHHAHAVRLAMQFVPNEASARDAVQDAWLGVIAGLEGFEGRSSFRTWLFSIVINCAKKRGKKEARDVPIPFDEQPDSAAPAVPAARFATDGKWPGHWKEPPSAWPLPDDAVATRQLGSLIEKAIALLTGGQRQVITLRDVLGMSAEQACAALGISEANQRVLLHRARSRVRASLEETLGWAP